MENDNDNFGLLQEEEQTKEIADWTDHPKDIENANKALRFRLKQYDPEDD